MGVRDGDNRDGDRVSAGAAIKPVPAPFLTIDGCDEHAACVVVYVVTPLMRVSWHVIHDTAVALAAALQEAVTDALRT